MLRSERARGSSARTLWIVLSIFLFLTVIVWGLFAFDRGMWQDDTSFLAVANSRTGFMSRCCTSIVSPTRVLAGAPFAIALLTPIPLACLQLVYGLAWMVSGILVWGILGQLFPREQLLAFFGGCLTICATSDFLTDSLVSLHYQVAAVGYLASLYCLVRWWKSRLWRWLMPIAAFLSLSVWTADAAFTSVLLTPLILWVWNDFRVSRRLVIGTAFWYAVFAPYAVVFVRFLIDPGSYAAVALVPMGWISRLERTWSLFALNFDPWLWGPKRTNWFAARARVIPVGLAVGLSIAGTIAFVTAGARIQSGEERRGRADSSDRRRWLGFAVLTLMMALGANAAFANVQISEYFYRTQIMSRYWVSMFIALVAIGLSRTRGVRKGAFVLPVVFVGLGLYGGLDRQDYYLGYWRRHRDELRSIIQAVPALTKPATLVLEVPAHRPYLAAAANYLAQCWAALLYDDPSSYNRTYLWDASRSECSLDGDRLICREGLGRPAFTTSLAECNILQYCVASNRFEPVDEATLSALLGVRNVSGYAPERRTGSIRTRLARELLFEPPGLARFLPRESRARAQCPPEKGTPGLPVGSIVSIAGQKPGRGIVIIPPGPWDIAGWAADAPSVEQEVDSVVLTIDGSPIGSATLGLARPEDAKGGGVREFRQTGWRLRVAAAPVSDSRSHQLGATIHGRGGSVSRLHAGLITFR